MKYIVRKYFLDYEKEEKWLNQMSQKGYALTDYSTAKYTFKKCSEGEHIYRIILTDNEYFNASEDGLETLGMHGNKIYYRKKAKDGPFTIRTDIRQKAKHYEKLLTMLFIFTAIETALGIGNIAMYKGTAFGLFSLFIGIVMVLTGIYTGITYVLPIYRKIRNIKRCDSKE